MKKIFSVLALLALTVAVLAQEPVKKFEIKSGIVKNVTEVMGQKMESTLYFDNYGAQQATTMKVATPAGQVEITTIVKDGKTYVVNTTSKQVQEIPTQEEVNYLNLTDEIKAKFKVNEAGTETLDGKVCTKYTEVIEQNGQKVDATVWVWKGFPIKTELSVSGMKATTNAVEFNENAVVLPIVFEIPKF